MNGYILGHAENERRRLQQQGGLAAQFTDDVLRRAGLEKGMRVLDVGCGMGWPEMRYEAGVGAGGGFFGHEFYAETIRTWLPHIERLGVATASEIDVESLAWRLRAEGDMSGSEL